MFIPLFQAFLKRFEVRIARSILVLYIRILDVHLKNRILLCGICCIYRVVIFSNSTGRQVVTYFNHTKSRNTYLHLLFVLISNMKAVALLHVVISKCRCPLISLITSNCETSS